MTEIREQIHRIREDATRWRLSWPPWWFPASRSLWPRLHIFRRAVETIRRFKSTFRAR